MKHRLLVGAALFVMLLCAFAVRHTQLHKAVSAPSTDTLPQIVTETEPVPDAGLSGVVLTAPEALTVTPDAPAAAFTMTVSGVCPDGAPEGGRLCNVKLLKDGELIETAEDFLLQDGASLDFSVEIPFQRYVPAKDCVLTVVLTYKAESRTAKVQVQATDYPDEYYAMTSGDPYPYAITIFTDQNIAIVYGKNDEGRFTQAVKVFICSTGISTPRSGGFSLQRKYDWRALIHGVWGQYASWITGDILIHSVPYYAKSKTALNSAAYNLLGTSASAGCIRMRVCDCKWIYDYCPCGTYVTFVTGVPLPESIAYPTYDKLDLDSPYASWDPTDPDPDNPWKPEVPDISWSAAIPYYDELHTANTTLDRNGYASFAKTSEIFSGNGE